MNFNFQDNRASEVRAGIIIKVFENDPSNVTVKLNGPITPLEIVSAAVALIKYAAQMDQDQGLSPQRIKQLISQQMRSIKVGKQIQSERSDCIPESTPKSPGQSDDTKSDLSPEYPKSQLRKKLVHATHFITLTHRNVG